MLLTLLEGDSGAQGQRYTSLKKRQYRRSMAVDHEHDVREGKIVMILEGLPMLEEQESRSSGG